MLIQFTSSPLWNLLLNEALLGLLVWAIFEIIPMEATMKKIVRVVAIIIAVLMAISVLFGVHIA